MTQALAEDGAPLLLTLTDVDLLVVLDDVKRLVGWSRPSLVYELTGAPVIVRADPQALRASMRRVFRAIDIALARRVRVRVYAVGDRVRLVLAHDGVTLTLERAFAHTSAVDLLELALARASIERQCGQLSVDRIGDEMRIAIELPRGGQA